MPLPMVTGTLARPGGETDDGVRFNYASDRNGAKVLASNREAKNAKAALSDNADAYFITPCAAPHKWFLVELSEEVLVDTVVLSHGEYYSAPFNDIDVFVSRTYPPASDGGWTPLARLAVLHERGVQTFALPTASWAQFMVLAARSHHGDGRYCTLTQLSVHGKDTAEALREEMARAEAEVGEVAHALRAGSGGGSSDPPPPAEAVVDAPATAPVPPVVNIVVNSSAEIILGGGGSTPMENATLNVAAAPPSRPEPENATAFVTLELSTGENGAHDAAAATPVVPAAVAPSTGGGGGGQDNIFKTLVHKLKALELNVSVMDAYMAESSRYVQTIQHLDADVASLQQAAANASAALSALATRLAAIEARASSDAAQAQAQMRELRAKVDRAAAREIALACMCAMFMAVVLLARTAGDARGDAGDALSAVMHPTKRAVLALKRTCAALALANGFLGVLLHVSAGRSDTMTR